jgi:hypothetical protein
MGPWSRSTGSSWSARKPVAGSATPSTIQARPDMSAPAHMRTGTHTFMCWARASQSKLTRAGGAVSRTRSARWRRASSSRASRRLLIAFSRSPRSDPMTAVTSCTRRARRRSAPRTTVSPSGLGTGATLAAAVAPVPMPADRPAPGEQAPAEAAVERRSVVEREGSGPSRGGVSVSTMPGSTGSPARWAIARLAALRAGERGVARVGVGEVDQAGPRRRRVHRGRVRARPRTPPVGRMQSAGVARVGAPGAADSSRSGPGHGGLLAVYKFRGSWPDPGGASWQRDTGPP